MFEIFPVAGQLLNLLLDEYRSSLIAYSALIPTDDRKVLQNPGTSITHHILTPQLSFCCGCCGML